MALVQMILGDSCGVMIQVLAIHVVEKTEKILDLSPVQLTVSNSSQTSVDSVSLFVSDLSQVLKPGLSQAVSMLDSVIGVRSGVGTVHVS